MTSQITFATSAAPRALFLYCVLAVLGCAGLRAAAQNVYAPFSGAIYIVGADGTQISGASPAVCPQYAGLSCSSIGYANWCCPSSCSCHYIDSTGVVGCCPSGQSCSGTVAQSQIQTVTVTVYQTETQYVQPTSVYVGPAYVPPTTTQYAGGGPVYAGYCSTLYAEGPGLPTTRAGDCGTILVVSEAREGMRGSRGWYGWGVPVALAVNIFLGVWMGGVRRLFM